jgi:hypothetical protein
MKTHAAILLFLTTIALTSPAHAGILFFVNDSAGFSTASSGFVFLGTEDWEQSTLAPNSLTSISDPLAPGVANGPFPTGSQLAAGVTAQANTLGSAGITTSPRGANAISVASAGFAGTPTDQISSNIPNDSLDLLINPSGSYSGAVSLNPLYFDLAATTSTSNPGSVVITVYDKSNVLLGTQIMNSVDYSAGAFLGMVSTAGSDIGRINLWASTNPTNSVAGADNINVFGAANVAAVPEPSSAVLMLGLGTVGLLTRLRRRRSPAPQLD